jgi:hypothetical protein
VSETPDLDIEKSNATHKHFVGTLTEALGALDGSLRDSTNDSITEEGADDDTIFQNQFAALSLGKAKNEEGEVSSGDVVPTHSAQARPEKKKTGKGKKGKRSRCRPPEPLQNPPWPTLLLKAIASSRIKMDLCPSTSWLYIQLCTSRWS